MSPDKHIHLFGERQCSLILVFLLSQCWLHSKHVHKQEEAIVLQEKKMPNTFIQLKDLQDDSCVLRMKSLVRVAVAVGRSLTKGLR